MFLVKENIQDNIAIIDKDYIKIQPTLAKKEVPSLQDINKLKHHSTNESKNPERDYCFISVYVNGELIESKIIEIRLDDVLLEQRCLNVVGKENKFRQVIINNEMYDALVDYLKFRKEIKTDNPYLFIVNKNKNTKEPLSRNFGNRLLDKYKEICNIGKLHPHLLRAYFYNNTLHNAKYSIVQVANQAGHYSLNTTRGYITNEGEDLFKLANKL